MVDFILASASPRRKALLELLGLTFAVDPAGIDETVPDETSDTTQIARELAIRKATAISDRHPGKAVLAADTIVLFQRELLGKPRTASDARRMLRALRNRANEVITGVAAARSGQLHVHHVKTNVRMRNFSDQEIEAYIARGNPFDKAGGYAIQDEDFRPVKTIDGCQCNVIGLPLATAISLLIEAGVSIPAQKLGPLRPECASCPLYRQPNTSS